MSHSIAADADPGANPGADPGAPRDAGAGHPALDWLGLSVDLNRIGWNAVEVIARRAALMATGALTAPEAVEMTMEKGVALAVAQQNAFLSMTRGDVPQVAMRAMAEPYLGATDRNVARLRG